MRDGEFRSGNGHEGLNGAEHRAPGKTTLTQALQCKEASPGAGLVPVVQLAADAGAAAAPVADPFDFSYASGGGDRLPQPVQAKMERSFDADFSAVRVHQGAEAESVGALAFTRGTDVHFAPGQYDPGSDRGQALIGHELAHVVQQSEGRVAATTQAKGLALNDDDGLEREADEQGARAARGEQARSGSVLAGGGSAPLQCKAAGSVVQMVAQPTHWGSFIDTDYRTTGLGAYMHLEFDPGDHVDATKIGLTQSVRIEAGGGAVANDPTRANRMVGSGDGEGYFHDRVSTATNPVYGAPALGAGAGLDATAATNAPSGVTPTPVNATFELGKRVATSPGVFDEKNAWLRDQPERAASNNSSMTFETTALALEGTQAGTYYGSVSWGWRRDGAGTLTTIPLAVASEGVPTQNFLASAGAWNAAAATGTTVTRNDPTQCYRWSRGFVADYTVARGVTVTLNGTVGAGADEYASATIVDGARAGSSTYLKVADLRDQGDGAATSDLPIPNVHTVSTAGVELNQDVPGPWRHFDALPVGTRVVPNFGMTQRVTTTTFPIEEVEMVWVEVAQGALTGHAGYVRRDALADEHP